MWLTFILHGALAWKKNIIEMYLVWSCILLELQAFNGMILRVFKTSLPEYHTDTFSASIFKVDGFVADCWWFRWVPSVG